MKIYKTPFAVESAVKDAAKKSGGDVSKAISAFYFHRLLYRVFSDPEETFILKGGHSLLARTPDARYTRDVDLSTQHLTIDAAVEKLKELVAQSAEDFISFQHTETIKSRVEDLYKDGRKIKFDVFMGARKVQPISIDLVVDPIGETSYDEIFPQDRITIRGLPECNYRVYSVEKAISDKLAGILERHGQYPSSRVKDLADLVIYAKNVQMNAAKIRNMVRRELAARSIAQPQSFQIPDEWGDQQAKQYRNLLLGSPILELFPTISDAVKAVKVLIDPVLDGTALDDSEWIPEQMEWKPI